MVPPTTPSVARHTNSVTAVAMIKLWPKFSNDSEVCDFTEACSKRCKFSS